MFLNNEKMINEQLNVKPAASWLEVKRQTAALRSAQEY